MIHVENLAITCRENEVSARIRLMLKPKKTLFDLDEASIPKSFCKVSLLSTNIQQRANTSLTILKRISNLYLTLGKPSIN